MSGGVSLAPRSSRSARSRLYLQNRQLISAEEVFFHAVLPQKHQPRVRSQQHAVRAAGWAGENAQTELRFRVARLGRLYGGENGFGRPFTMKFARLAEEDIRDI